MSGYFSHEFVRSAIRQIRAERAAEQRSYVYLLEITVDEDGSGSLPYMPYVSVHATLDGARAWLEKRVDDLDMRDYYDKLDHHTYDQDTGSVQCGGESGDAICYGIHRAEVLK